MTLQKASSLAMRPAVTWTALVLLDVLVAAAITTAALRWPVSDATDAATGAGGPDDGHWWQRTAAECVVRPPVKTAAKAALEGGEEIVGVKVGGRARAYRLGAFRSPSRHVVNDLIDGVPVSVTYCDFRDSARVFTDAGRAAPLDVTPAGLRDGRMVLLVGGVLVDQESGRQLEAGTGHTLPFAPLEATRMTWDAWRRLHPGTELYDGMNGRDDLSTVSGP
jgi:hypothetical protein